MEKHYLFFFLFLFVVNCKSVSGITKSLEPLLDKPENFDNATLLTTQPYESEYIEGKKGNVGKRDSIIDIEEDNNLDYETPEFLPKTLENDSQGKIIEHTNEIVQENELNWGNENNGFSNSDFQSVRPPQNNFVRIKPVQKAGWEHKDFLASSLSHHNTFSDFQEVHNHNSKPFINNPNFSRQQLNNYNHHNDLANQMHLRYKFNPSIDLTFDKVPEHRAENKPIVLNLKTECQACHHNPIKSHNIPEYKLIPNSHFSSHPHAKLHYNHHPHNSLICPTHALTTNIQHSSLITPNHNSLKASNVHNPVISTLYYNPLISTTSQNLIPSTNHRRPLISSIHTSPIFCK